MKKILLFGAGKSATVLIRYLLDHAAQEHWQLTIAEANPELAQSKLNNHPSGKAIALHTEDAALRRALITEADIVISMLPPALHIFVARDCLDIGRNLLTASYIDEALLQLKASIEARGLLFLCETGLDPGIDHMSAMQLLDRIRQNGGMITGFKSHCGGLIAPENDNNPWHYKISWNPRNIALAGSAGAVYKENGTLIEISYDAVFENCTTLEVPALGKWACYPNRNSLTYIPVYQLETADTVIRTTIRHPGFCIAWNFIVKAGLSALTDTGLINSYRNQSIAAWFTACLNFHTRSPTFEDFLQRYVPAAEQQRVDTLFRYLGLLDTERIPPQATVSADILQYLLETRLPLAADDRDMIVMIHEIAYQVQGLQRQITSSLVVKGTDAGHTAMAKTVGLPLGIAAKLILSGQIRATGLQIPTIKEIYEPILLELQQYAIRFTEEDNRIPV
ncbi:saccharopine dehydrogenase NADP-binding domain-containing protein [Niabella pedocola]|uniref:Saccharopine dehydrogenase NADP-binding domain-containing protein n=1 Tax=Niabella pedocola TaxID=1752077 RepID=A0ABS8PJX7_9BACT|nr:saccharopine dehydrogenase C-terminal domain-containing protein [Niabella pedocola]MCD2421395.1 saccharopine dehydrogenase NADP-binding domain-containing protein [Niabella pedocola]